MNTDYYIIVAGVLIGIAINLDSILRVSNRIRRLLILWVLKGKEMTLHVVERYLKYLLRRVRRVRDTK